MAFGDVDFLSMVHDLEGTGFYEVVLPFLLIFTVIFAVLEKAKIFGQNSRRFNGVIALVSGFLMIRNDMLVEFMNDIIARFSVVLVVILAFLIIFGIFGSKTEQWGKGFFAFFVIIALIAGIWILADRMGYYDITGETDFETFLEDHGGKLLIVCLFLLFLGIIFLGGNGAGNSGNFFERAGTQLGHPRGGS
jgi:hypothetical protein